MHPLRRALLWLTLCAGVAAAWPVQAETGSERMDRGIAQALAMLLNPAGEPSHSRARFMACGYVAPILASTEEPSPGGDAAFARMLEWLRFQLRRVAE